MVIGYGRVSTDDQNLDSRRNALRLAGCEKLHKDQMSSAKVAPPGLSWRWRWRASDVLTVCRLGRSLDDLIPLGAGSTKWALV